MVGFEVEFWVVGCAVGVEVLDELGDGHGVLGWVMAGEEDYFVGQRSWGDIEDWFN